MAHGSAIRRAGRACLAALAGLLLALPATARAAPVSSEFYGINMPLLFSWSADRWDAHLSALSASGAGLVRADAAWWTAEPSPPVGGVHAYTWASFDQQVSAMATRGLRWYPVMAFSTPWSGVLGDDKSAPRSVAEYTDYVAAFAARYGRGGSFWRENPGLPQLPVTTYEIWNEQNSPHFWEPQSDAPERYADLYLAARGVIKRADPGARVVVGGLSNVPSFTPDTDFLRRMYARRPDARGKVDAVAFHPYSVSVAGVYSEIRRMRRALSDLGQGGVPLEITEVGWTSTRNSDAERGEALATLVRELPRSDCNVSRLIPYSWITREQDPADDEDWFGIYNLDGTPKPSGTAFTQAVREMTSAAAPDRAVTICGSGATSATRAGKSHRSHLGVRVRVRGSLARGLRVRARCSDPCRARVEVLARRRGGGWRRLAKRSLRRYARSQRARIGGGRRLLRLGRGSVRLRVRAAGHSGRSIVVRPVRRR